MAATGRAGSGSVCWRTVDCPQLEHRDTRLVRDRSRDGDFRIRLWSSPAQEKRNTIMNWSWPRRRGGRHAEGGPQRRVHADQSRAVGVDQDRPLAAPIGRLDAPRRSPECGAGGVDARTQPPGGLATLGRWRRQAMCSRHHPLWTTADVAAFLMCESTAARQLLQIAARRVAGLAPI